MRRAAAIDMPLFICFLILVGLGIVFVYSASFPPLLQRGGTGFEQAWKQILFAVMGLALMFACILTPLPWLRRMHWVIVALTIGVLVFVIFFGMAKHGNRAWIDLGPLGRFQPAEFARVAIVLTLAGLLAKRPWTVKSWRGLFSGPFWYLLIPVGLIAAQGDLGSMIVVGSGTVAMLALGGTRFRFWGIPLFGLLILFAFAISLLLATGHGGSRVERFRAWREPFNQSIPQSYQPRFSLLAVGSGGLFGLGLGKSREKYYYLPAAHNDYIFAIIAEELGFLKTLVFLLGPYLFVICRGFVISHRAPDEYSALVAGGCTAMLATQALINIAVVMNVLPCMGINLPFISSGGSSMLASMMMAGLILNVSTLRTPRRAARKSRALAPATG